MTVHDVARALPDVPALRNLCRSMAMVEAVLNPVGERFHSFNSTWSATEELASMRNGSGDEFDIVFPPAGAYVRGFDHESPFSPYHHDDVPRTWPGVVDSVPPIFQRYVHEPAFTDENGTPVVTACLWREAEADHWQAGQIDFPDGHPDPDGSTWLFELLVDPTPEAFQAFGEDYYETTIAIDAIRHVYDLRPLDRALIASLNPTASVEDVAQEAAAIGYPLVRELSLTTD
ncbi:hypothetical protein ACIBMX_01665 [Streptomyces phaeochromogenes]|uniref:hypothetical protein n=1 Tax=Streptomyces phaeochromogenes TaxID=1923 RepID=UPI0033FC5D99